MADEDTSITAYDPSTLPHGSIKGLDTDAKAIFEIAPDLDTAQKMLAEAYGSYQWDKPEDARDITQKYSDSLRNRFRDESKFSNSELSQILPQRFSDTKVPEQSFGGAVTDEVVGGVEDALSFQNSSPEERKNKDAQIAKINAWVDQNTELIKSDPTPYGIVHQTKQLQSLEDTAKEMKRQVYTNGQNTLGDLGFRFAEGLLSGPANALGLFTDAPKNGIAYLQEHTKDAEGSDLGAYAATAIKDLAGGAGFITGAEVGGIPYFATAAAGQTINRYQESYKKSGDRSQALESAAIEGTSQAIQSYFGSRLLGKSLGENPTISETLKGLVQKSAAFGGLGYVGQIASNEAANVGSGRPIGENAYEGADRALAGGALLGAAIGAKDAAVAGRTTQLPDIPPPDQGGTPISQTISPVEGKDYQAPYVSGTVVGDNINEVSTDNPEQVENSFTTEDGNTYTVLPAGNTQRAAPTGTVYHPLDKTFYVDDSTAAQIAEQRILPDDHADKFHVTTEEGELVAHMLDDSGRVAAKTKIKASTVPEPGTFPLGVNEVKASAENTRVYQNHLGTKITEVNDSVTPEGQSTGAAFTKETQFGETLRNSSNLSDNVKSLFGDEESGYLRYFPTDKITLEGKGKQKIGEVGIEAATQHFLSDNVNADKPSTEDLSLGQALFRHFTDAANKADVAGDTQGFEQISSALSDVTNKISKIRNTLGTSFRLAGFLSEELKPRQKAAAIRGKLTQDAISKVAESEGLKPEDLSGLNSKIDSAKEELQTQKQVDKASSKEGEPVVDSERTTKAQEKVDKLSKLQKAVQKKIAENQLKFTPEEEKDYVQLHEAERTAPESLKSRYRQAIEKIESRVEPDNQENQIKRSVLRYLGDNLKTIASGLKSYFIGNLLGPGSIVKKLSTDTIAALSTPAFYASTGNIEASKAFITEIAKSWYNTSKNNPVEAIKSSRALNEFVQTLLTGDVAGKDFLRSDFTKGISEGLKSGDISKNPFRLVGTLPRILTAITNSWHSTIESAQAAALGADTLKRGGGTEEVRSTIADHLYNSSKVWDTASKRIDEQSAALERLTGKGLTDREKQSATWDAVKETLPDGIRKNADTFAQKSTLTNHPTGFAGKIYDAFLGFRNIPINILGIKTQPLHYEFPFVKVGLNLINYHGFDLTPVGILRSAFSSEYIGAEEPTGYREKPYLERAQELGRGVVGTILIGSLLGKALAHKDDDLPEFMVNGPGSPNWQVKGQDLSKGKIPYSLQFGNQFTSYKDTVLQVPLEIVGTIMDRIRGGSLDPKDYPAMMQVGATAALGVVTDLSMFKSIGDLWEGITNKDADPDRGAQKIKEALLINPAAGMIPFHGVARFFDNSPIDKYKDLWSSVISGVPYIENLGDTRPALNYFGEPISKNLKDRFGAVWGLGYASSNIKDVSPEWRWLAQNNYSLPEDQNINIHIVPGQSKDRYSNLLEKRAENLGPKYSNVLTGDERNQLIQTAGPKIKALVSQYANQYGNSGRQESIQEQLKKDVSRIFNDTKKEMFIK